MTQLTASRTLVKSTPELWAECSDAASLARHLGVFSEIRITRLEPETAVAWEGEDVRGTVTLEPSGWGTRVVLTASAPPAGAGARPGEQSESGALVSPGAQTHPAAGADPTPVPDPDPQLAPAPRARPGFLRRLFAGLRRPAAPDAPAPGPDATALGMPDATAPPEPDATASGSSKAPGPGPQPAGTDALVRALDSLGTAHRRPFSHS